MATYKRYVCESKIDPTGESDRTMDFEDAHLVEFCSTVRLDRTRYLTTIIRGNPRPGPTAIEITPANAVAIGARLGVDLSAYAVRGDEAAKGEMAREIIDDKLPTKRGWRIRLINDIEPDGREIER